ncbi:MAG: Gfo/Idh/MocA family oxidoreductase [Chloroflexi bacterium]|nr:Gfo/Idh/MocA family oxidoreductase [Chloroflexota bacterium]
MAVNPLRVGVIGVGFGTTVHVPGFLSEGAQVVAVCARHKERVEKAARDFSVPHAFTDYREMLAMDGLDAVSIATPPSSHCEMALAALRAGKHVLCEKPFAMDQGEALQMLAEAQRTGRTAMISHEFRFAPGRAYLKELLEQGYVGQVQAVHMTLFRGPTERPRPRAVAWGSQATEGGGFLGALGSHYIDCLRDWAGEVSRVCGMTHVHDPNRVDPATGNTVVTDADDGFSFVAALAGGGWASMSASSQAPFGPGALLQVYGTEGALHTPQAGFNPPSDGVVLGARFGEGNALHDLPIPSRFRPFVDERDDRLMAFRILVRRFMRGIAEGTSPSPGFYDGYRCQQVLDAVRASAKGAGWVDIPEE